MRGSGKTSVSKLLAKHRSMNRISTDEKIVELESASISEIVKSKGWPYFRMLEKKVIHGLKVTINTIVDTGGGAILDEENVRRLKTLGRVIWLNATIEVLNKRIGADSGRPHLTSESDRLSELKLLLKERELLYRNMADQIIDTSGKTPQKIVEEIIQ